MSAADADAAGALSLSQPRERHGARLPFDFFLRSLADELGERAICVILSGTGSDGSLGLKGPCCTDGTCKRGDSNLLWVYAIRT